MKECDDQRLSTDYSISGIKDRCGLLSNNKRDLLLLLT